MGREHRAESIEQQRERGKEQGVRGIEKLVNQTYLPLETAAQTNTLTKISLLLRTQA